MKMGTMKCQATNAINAMVKSLKEMERPKAGCGSALSHPLLVPDKCDKARTLDLE